MVHHKIKSSKSLSIILLSSLLLVSCITNVKNKGYKIEDQHLSSLKVNHSTKADVLNVLGTPSTKSNFDPETWYYIYSKNESIAFLKPKQVEKKVVAIKLHNDLIVAIEQFNEIIESKITVNNDYTLTKGDDQSLLKSFLGDIGRFNNKKPKQAVNSGTVIP